MDSPELVATPATLVRLLRERGDLEDPRIEAAFAHVPRHLFVPNYPRERVYAETSFSILEDVRGNSLLSAVMPSMIATALHQLDLQEGQNVLEIGAGTGYTAALLQHIVGEEGTVTSLEIDRNIIDLTQTNLIKARTGQVHVVHCDGAEGYAPRAAYDRILSSVGIWDMPPAWIRQVKPTGRIVTPVWIDGLQVSAAFIPQEDGTLYAKDVKPSMFVYIRGVAAGPNVRKRVGSTAMTLLADDVDQIDTASLSLLLSADEEECHLTGGYFGTSDYWYGFLPYVMLNESDDEVFALYEVRGGYQAFGVEGEGFAMLTPASASFVPYYGRGKVHCFAGADAYLEVERLLMEWNDLRRPTIDCLEMRLIPKSHGEPKVERGKVYARRDHYLHVWMEMPEKDDAD
jgi:protein-L-isoaspartate(D-aspartate) O-methyltransferase